MKRLQEIITTLHTSTKRDYLGRMMDEKIHCMKVAKKFGIDYWDGERKYGYGGYKYIAGRWKSAAEKIISIYNLNNSSKILDVGCGKAFLIFEIKKILPKIKIKGFDISKYAIENAPLEIKDNLIVHDVAKDYPFKDKEFDLVISINTLHNLKIFDLEFALNEISRVSEEQYLCVESFRNEEELFNLECWALTCQSFFSKDEWEWIFNKFKYDGDYEFIYF